MAVFVQLIGQVGSGKSFLARELALVKEGVVLSFAKDVYRLAVIAKGGQIDKSRREDRELLKFIGTEWGREARALPRELEERLEAHKPKEWGTADMWARIFVANCRAHAPHVSIINDDTRFLNELQITMATMKFIPVFVACSEETRRERLRRRGDAYDPNSTAHLSEELSNFLRSRVLTEPIMPVVWNDPRFPPPPAPWVHEWSTFRSIVESSRSNAELAEKLRWCPERARSLVALIRANLSQPAADLRISSF